MSIEIRRVCYFTAMAVDRPGSAYQVLQELAHHEINLVAFSCVPIGPRDVQFTLYPEQPERLQDIAPKLGMTLTPEQHAILVHGDDEIGALTRVHHRLFDAQINVYASNGVTDARGNFGYLIHVRPDDVDRACDALNC